MFQAEVETIALGLLLIGAAMLVAPIAFLIGGIVLATVQAVIHRIVQAAWLAVRSRVNS